MLARITGQLVGIRTDRVHLAVGPAVIDVFVPGSDLEEHRRREGTEVELHTLLVLEGIGQGTSMVPRVIGFRSAQDRAFFELFTTVKNIGHRKALRALQVTPGEIAAAIARRDVSMLVALPEIGRRTAETIIAELHGKVDDFLHEADVTVVVTGDPALRSVMHDAVAMLVALGERQDAARTLVERAMAANPDVQTPEDLLAAVMSSR